MQYEYHDIHCPKCGKLLAKGDIISGFVEFKCKKCKHYYTLRATRPNPAPHDGPQEYIYVSTN